MLYFAYGSNMYTPRLRHRVRSAKPVGRATLLGYELRWHKLSRKDGSGKCNARMSKRKGAKVYGVVFEIADDEKSTLDGHEGLGYGYNEYKVTVQMGEKKVEAVTYLADDAYIEDSLRPLSWYKAFVLSGAREHKLPKGYVKRISSQWSRKDGNPARDREERAKVLLSN